MKLDSAPPSLADFKTNSTAILEKTEPVYAQLTPKIKQSSFRTVFSSTFITIFLAELGDKTQLSTLLMSAESHSPWTVFLGAATALVSTSLLGVILGQWLANRLSPRTIETAAGVSLLFIAATLLWDVAQF